MVANPGRLVSCFDNNSCLLKEYSQQQDQLKQKEEQVEILKHTIFIFIIYVFRKKIFKRIIESFKINY